MNKEKDNKNAEISARVTSLISYLQETPNSFAIKLGYKRAQTLYDILNMKSAPSYDFFLRFVNSEYSAIIETDWLITGKEPMLRSKQSLVDIDETVPYKMYKDLEAKSDRLIKENTLLEEKIRRFEEGDDFPKEFVPDVSTVNPPRKGSGAGSHRSAGSGESGKSKNAI